MAIRNILELSTSHLTKDTAERMDNGHYCICRYDYGALVYVDPWQVAHYKTTSWPKDLIVCIEYALLLNCDYILFDSDEEPIEDLPTYEW